MVRHQFSIRFKKDTDDAFKQTELQRTLGQYFEGFIECYPHLIEIRDIPHMPGHEMWILKFAVEIPEGNNPTIYDEQPRNQITVCEKCGKEL